jgi:L,D-peptidoglycan transpeptidase YkuD (ErfK/YbiS/YcfS/YnhG family)
MQVFTVNAERELVGPSGRVRCALGKGGIVAAEAKREGDGATPAGDWVLRRVFYRADKVQRPETALAAISLRVDDGWCDDPAHALYNCPVLIPFPASHEKMWRKDDVYDVVVELGYNDDQVIPGKGSAIFLHVARHDYAPTEGCVALAQTDLLALLACAKPGDVLRVLL